ncbi:hypothetical protein Halru_0542 [Halovivax ruber XH-70]|uniref:Membrane-bound metal-dependent hydrolase (DUF457) n=1 Tax=Halovivax ruber (strain DSM 18193 / JCM 13892 / XH-70) TaxID=797302 RepID=L0I6K0_HALRX|nr:hypothetical protein Halru_0542 [Halovivax ruber XH-70]
MMATTHALVGLALVAPIAVVAPDVAAPLAAGAIVGGIAPDLDLLFTHRRTFHFPVLGAGPAAAAMIGATIVSTPAAVGLAAFLTVAWVHAVTDVVGGGAGFDPWTNPIDRAVFDHWHGQWIRPRRWIRYDGAPEDAALGALLAIPALVVFDGPVRPLVALGLLFSVGYALVRRRLPSWIDE